MPRANRQLTSAVSKRSRPEDCLQRAVVELLSIYERQGKLRYFAIPNGGKRSKIEAAIMKGLGVRAGVPDILVIMRDGSCVWLELKAPKGVVSDAQEDWLEWLGDVARHGTAVIRDAKQVPLALGLEQRRTA